MKIMASITSYRGNPETASKAKADEKAITAITWKEELEVQSVHTRLSMRLRENKATI